MSETDTSHFWDKNIFDISKSYKTWQLSKNGTKYNLCKFNYV